MSRIVFFCIPAHGHTNPTSEVVKELLHQGHKVPLVMYPQTNEQKGVAFRINELGAGIYLSGNSVSDIKTAVRELLQRTEYKEQAAVISVSFSKCGGSKAAAEKILNICSC